MIRLNIIVEGHTEEAFVHNILSPFLGESGVFVQVRRVETGRSGGKIYRGGMPSYEKIKKDVERWTKEDKAAWYTTMFDLYALTSDFPGIQDACAISNPFERVEKIEEHFKNDINNQRFIPYIQLHEFEALLLAEPQKFSCYYLKDEKPINCLQKLCEGFESPEHINQGAETAPSKRIIKEIPSYENEKRTAGPIMA